MAINPYLWLLNQHTQVWKSNVVLVWLFGLFISEKAGRSATNNNHKETDS